MGRTEITTQSEKEREREEGESNESRMFLFVHTIYVLLLDVRRISQNIM